MNDLFTVTFGENFKVTLNHPLWIVENPYKLKEEVKRGLLEMVDVHSKLSLAYSGGSDSGFILCCVRDLIEESKLKKDTIEVFQGVFIINNEPQYDKDRSTEFANSLGFDPRIVEINLDKDTDVWTNLWDQNVKFIETHGGIPVTIGGMIPCALQNYVTDMQDSVVIGGALTIGDRISNDINEISEDVIRNDGWYVSLYSMEHYDLECNHLDVFTWDNEILSCFISPMKLKKNLINTEPFKRPIEMLQHPSHPVQPRYLEQNLHKWITFVQCYPEMNEILYKFRSNGYAYQGDYEFFERGLPSRYGKETKTTLKLFEFRKFFASWPYRNAKVTLPSGELYTIKHLTNYKDYFVGENDE